MTLGGSGGESFWEEGGDFGVDVLHFHTCLTDIIDFLEKLEWWFEQEIDDEEGEGGSEDSGYHQIEENQANMTKYAAWMERSFSCANSSHSPKHVSMSEFYILYESAVKTGAGTEEYLLGRNINLHSDGHGIAQSV
ncbi:hypothetical protein Tco_1042222 [Tanacetum coccineum]|uniref:Uncharacterized protein n=1 Tax=Tanacetum coccineum TaxID=301880 RepID=A0ABQ5GIE8_9ASTR